MKEPGHDNAVRAFRCILRNTELVTENVMWVSLLERFDPNSSIEQSEISKDARRIFYEFRYDRTITKADFLIRLAVLIGEEPE